MRILRKSQLTDMASLIQARRYGLLHDFILDYWNEDVPLDEIEQAIEFVILNWIQDPKDSSGSWYAEGLDSSYVILSPGHYSDEHYPIHPDDIEEGLEIPEFTYTGYALYVYSRGNVVNPGPIELPSLEETQATAQEIEDNHLSPEERAILLEGYFIP